MTSNKPPNPIFSIRHIVFAALCWGVSLYALLEWTAGSNIAVLEPKNADETAAASADDELGTFSFDYFAPDRSGGADYAVRFSRLQVANAKIGLFRTALCRQITVQDLTFTVDSHPAEADNYPVRGAGRPVQSPTAEPSPAPTAAALFVSDLAGLQEHLSHRFRTLFDAPAGMTVTLPDMAQTIRIHIDRFRFDWRVDGQDALGVSSGNASFDARSGDRLTLRGAVKITTPGGTLRSNHVVWDLNEHLFHAVGNCMIIRQGRPQVERDIRFDTALNILDTHPHSLTQGDALCRTDVY